MPAGRPTDYTPELADMICSRIAEGESMRSISRDESMPCMTTLFKWLREIPEFTQQYNAGKEQCHSAWFEDINDISDNQVGNPVLDNDGKPLILDGKPVMVVDGPAVNHARLRVDSRKWALSKLMPKKYGDYKQIEHSGELGLRNIPDDKLDDEIATLLSDNKP